MKIFQNSKAINSQKLLTIAFAFLFATTTLAACANPVSSSQQGGDIHKIQHVVVIMQENRSFDSYFGTYPGADGIPMQNGTPTVCVPDPLAKQCVKPFHDPNDRNGGGPHGNSNAIADINSGQMNGFQIQAEKAHKGCIDPNNPACANAAKSDVMGYHDAREIPNYWAYASHFVLQDHMFEPNASWSLPQHLSMVSEWSAYCATVSPQSCRNALQSPGLPPDFQGGGKQATTCSWTDLSYLLYKGGVNWKYYVQAGVEPDCRNDAADCPPVNQNAKTQASGTRCPTSPPF